MYPIDFSTCSARDVIARSVTCHPSTFADRLRDLASTHWQYSRVTHDAQAAASALNLHDACNLAAMLIGEENVDEICGDFNARIVAFSVAADLQLAPRHLRAEIIER